MAARRSQWLAPEARLSLWLELPIGYLLSVMVEALVLLFALSPVHPRWRKWSAAFWLTGCSYPIVVLVLPASTAATIGSRMPASGRTWLNPGKAPTSKAMPVRPKAKAGSRGRDSETAASATGIVVATRNMASIFST